VPRKEREQVARDLKPVYTAVDADAAQEALERFHEGWGQRFPVITKAWLDAWEYVIPFLAFPEAVRRVIYTTDESVKAAAQFQGSYRSCFPVLVAEVGGCEGVARRQGCRRNRVRMVS
jgi:transposase-like protein